MELQIKNLRKRYGSKIAAENINLTLTNGIYGLLGANGAGKTTLMKMVSTVQRPTSGKIFYNGKNIETLGNRYTRLLGFLPQKFSPYSDFTLTKFLSYTAALKGIERNVNKEILIALESVGLTEKKNAKIRTLSGGMKQRLGIAQALMGNPKIIILDEPTRGLDPGERIRLKNILSELSADHIIILSTHIVSDIQALADNIIIMKNARILHKGLPEEITSRINGKVWEFLISPARVKDRSSKFTVSRLQDDKHGLIKLRVIRDKPPVAEAISVAPDLEDLYMYYFKGETGNEKVN